MKTLVFLVAFVALLMSGCATVELPLADGSDKTMTFRGFASNMTIEVPSAPDANGNPIGNKTVNINAHFLEGPVLEAVKVVAPFAAMATQ